jgi:anti-sigma B factor antagonist
MGVSLTSRKVGNVLVIDMAGRLTVLDQSLKDKVLETIKAGDRQIVLNMKELSYIDSSELGQLMSAHAAVKEAGGSLRLLAPSPQVRQLLNITRLETVFDVIDDESRLGK